MTVREPSTVESPADLADFVRSLREDLLADGGEWENPTLERYLAALARVVEDSHGRHGAEPTWQVVALLLDSAVAYE
jgi:hypothetical protein